MSSYRDIFKSSLFVGSQQVARIVISAIQGKVNALLLGTAGTGLIGVYSSLLSVTQAATGLGIGTSGVRQVASAAGAGDAERLSQTVCVLRRTCLVLGSVGTLALLIFSRPLSRLSFQDPCFWSGVAVLAPAVLFAQAWTGHMAVLQGLRRIRDMSLANVTGTALAAVVSVALIVRFRERGIAPSFAAGWALSLLCSWLFVRRFIPRPCPVPRRAAQETVRELLQVGVAIMAANVAMTLAAYLLRALIVRRLGIAAVGLYQAGWTLTGFYVGMVLQATGTDFLPRLTAALGDRTQANRLVNEQVEMGVLMAAPGVLAMIVFVPWVIRLLYSADFLPAVSMSRWMGIGIAFRVVCWPLNYLQIALGRSRQIVLTELAFHASLLAASAAAMRRWGLDGIGISVPAVYLPYTAGLYLICRRMTGFRWSRPVRGTLLFLLLTLSGGFYAVQLVAGRLGLWMGAGLTALTAALCLLAIVRLLGAGFFRPARGPEIKT